MWPVGAAQMICSSDSSTIDQVGTTVRKVDPCLEDRIRNLIKSRHNSVMMIGPDHEKNFTQKTVKILNFAPF
jgi:hypothetical protein